MTLKQRGTWWHRTLAVVAALAMTGGALAVSSPAAIAAPSDAVEATGSLDWGIKESFRNYIGGNIAKGTSEVSGGASVNADGTFHFPVATVDPAAQTVSFGGVVSFSGHNGLLAVNISDIRVDLARGFIVADVVSKSLSSAAMETYDDVDLATVASGAAITDGSMTGTALPTSMAAAGVQAFADFYAVGTAFDSATFTANYVVPVVVPAVTLSPVAQSVETGAAVQFKATATGHDSVQWQLKAAGADVWTDIVEATDTTLNITTDVANNGSQYRAAFTNAGGTVYSESAVLTVTEAEVPGVVWSPAVEVFAADGKTALSGVVAEGAKIVVKGTGFDPEANVASAGSRPPIAAGSPAGTYVVFGKFAEQWRPSEGASSAGRVVGDQLWAMSQSALDAVPAAYQNAVRGQWVEIAADGSFTAELTVKKKVVSGAEVEWPEAGNFGVYTYAAGSTTNADQEVFAPINVGEPDAVKGPVLTVEPATGLKHESSVVISGSGYAPDRWIYVAEVAQGPGSQKRPEVYENAVRVQTNADGEFGPLQFSVTTIFKEGGFTAVADKLYLSTFNSPLSTDNDEHDHASDRSQDAYVALAWADPSAPPATEPEVPEPEMPVAKPTLSLDAKTVMAGRNITLNGENFSAGSTLAFDLDGEALQIGAASTEVRGGLDWGVKESFRNYLKGGVAKGDVAASNGAKINANGSYHFPAASFNATSKIAAYSGTVSMTGHDGALQVQLSNLRVDVEGQQLLADVTSKSLEGTLENYSDIALVSLNTTGVSADATAMVGKNLPTMLTAAGVPAFADFYPEKTAFDELSFDIQHSAAPVPLLVDGSGKFSVVWSVPQTQKAGNYIITAAATVPQSLLEREIPNIETASAALQISASDKTPGPVDTEVPAPTKPVASDPTTTTEQCTSGAILNGTLTWGVKESFRHYINGPIAQGQVFFNNSKVDKDALFTFTEGSGTIDPIKRTGNVAFDGEVSFQGHDYGTGPVLSVTIANVVLVMDGNVGTLKADVVSRSLDSATAGAAPGADISYDSVILASLDLSKSALNAAETIYAGQDLRATLAPSGVAPFADFYAAGDTLDPVSFALDCSTTGAGDIRPAGSTNASGAADTDTTGSITGPNSLAKTGVMALDASVIGALLILLLGTGAITGNRLARRRRG